MKKEYVLITPAHNEEQFIEKTIKSVVMQTILPKKWIIVDDASSDATGEIIKQYANQYDFITYLRLTRQDKATYYGHRTCVVLDGYKEIKKLDFDFLGALDADITLLPAYYEGILQKFEQDPKLGIAAGVFFYEVNGHLKQALMDRLCTPGSHQVFRRECYEQIGGYIPLKYGGDDSLADIMARMYGWKTWSFDEYPAIQHRTVGTGGGRSILYARFRQGLTDYGIATHPMFMLAKLLRRSVLEKPYFAGSLARLVGFLYGYWLREERLIPSEVIRFVRKEQLKRLLSRVPLFSNSVSPNI
ncbi:MAG: glycosyltransferase family A protein [Phycisphaerae bacterium]|jgi:glycosyltransferase involved in cell wall biosynthesis